MELSIYSNRLIFDHLTKTGGQAINKWLSSQLGSGSVTNNLVGNHHILIKRYGGTHPIISGHIQFDGRGFDPRYQYITLIREPIDRGISWLYFILNNHTENDLNDLWRAANDFMMTDGKVLSNELFKTINNYYINHFSFINFSGQRPNEIKFEQALKAIDAYDVWGLYEEMPYFLRDVATLIGIPAPKSIEHINITNSRPTKENISHNIRHRLEDVMSLDIALYKELCIRFEKAQLTGTINSSKITTQFLPYSGVKQRVFTIAGFKLLSAILQGSPEVIYGQTLIFNIDFIINEHLDELEIGIHILDEDLNIAFGTNTTLLKNIIKNISAGKHCIQFELSANLPYGNFTAGFAFNSIKNDEANELAWFDKLVNFQVKPLQQTSSIGYVSLPVEANYFKNLNTSSLFYLGSDSYLHTLCGKRDGASIVSTGKEGFLIYGPYVSLPKGSYWVMLSGDFSGLMIGAWIDITSESGARTITKVIFDSSSELPLEIQIPFELIDGVTDLEVRLWVSASAKCRLDSLAIKPAVQREGVMSVDEIETISKL
jgi:hypothetical protein